MKSVSNEIIYKRIPERREITKRAYNVMSIQVYDQIWKETENRVRGQITNQIWSQVEVNTQLNLSL
jgi:regulator of sigma D